MVGAESYAVADLAAANTAELRGAVLASEGLEEAKRAWQALDGGEERGPLAFGRGPRRGEQVGTYSAAVRRRIGSDISDGVGPLTRGAPWRCWSSGCHPELHTMSSVPRRA